MPTLFVRTDPQKKSVSFSSYATIGRASRCTLSIKDDIKLSRVHCEILRDEDDFVLIDLHSQNGTNLNGKPVTETLLRDGDILAIGKCEIVFCLPETEQRKLPEYRPLAVKKIGPKDM